MKKEFNDDLITRYFDKNSNRYSLSEKKLNEIYHNVFSGKASIKDYEEYQNAYDKIINIFKNNLALSIAVPAILLIIIGTILYTQSDFTSPPPTPQKFIIYGDTIVNQNDIAIYRIGNPDKQQIHWEIHGGQILGVNTSDTIFVQWTNQRAGRLNVLSNNNFLCSLGVQIISNDTQPPSPNLPILGNTIVCQNDTEIYRIENPENHQVRWNVQGGRIIGSNNTNEISVLWTNPVTGQLEISVDNQDRRSNLNVTITEQPVITSVSLIPLL